MLCAHEDSIMTSTIVRLRSTRRSIGMALDFDESIGMPLDLDESRGMFEAAGRHAVNFINLIHDIDGSKHASPQFNHPDLAQAREKIEEAFDLIALHMLKTRT
jgi:hypothetical protein